MKNSNKALLYGLAAVCIWSTVASAFKITLRTFEPAQLLLVANIASALALAGVLAFQGRLGALRGLSRKGLVRAALLGAVNPFLYYLVLFRAYDLLPAQEAQPINYTWAVTLSLLSVPLLGQKLRPRDLLAILISYAGVVAISVHGDFAAMRFTNLEGVGFALGSTVIWALYWIWNTKDDTDPVAGLFLNFLFGLPLTLAACLILSGPPPLNLAAWGGAVYVGLFEMGFTFALWLAAMKHAAMPDGGGTARVANLIFLSPFLSLVLIHFLVGEEIAGSTVYGLALIIAGNALMQYKGKATA